MKPSGSAYRLLGYTVWRGGKWYVRRTYLSRLPSRRAAALGGLAALGVAGVAVSFARRALG